MGIGMTLRHFEEGPRRKWRRWRKNISKDGTCATAPLGIGPEAYLPNGAEVAHPLTPAFEVAHIAQASAPNLIAVTQSTGGAHNDRHA